MAQTMAQLEAEIAELQAQAVEEGRSGEEYDTHWQRRPRPPYRLIARCYYDAVPLYEFLIGYIKECSAVGAPVPFDDTILDRYDRYCKIMFQRDDYDDIFYIAVTLSSSINFVKQMLNGEIAYLKAMQNLVQFLDLGYDRYPSDRVSTKRQYKGDIAVVDALVDRYCARLAAHTEECHRIARENVKRREQANE